MVRFVNILVMLILGESGIFIPSLTPLNFKALFAIPETDSGAPTTTPFNFWDEVSFAVPSSNVQVPATVFSSRCASAGV